MPSEKAARSAARKRVRNRTIRSSTRTMVNKAVASLQGGSPEEAEAAVLRAVRSLDKADTKGVLHRNNAARKKARLAAKLNALKAS
ncbi:MAG: 30S ribosomal protein S20 [Dehalococcoidia bacterium]|nr:30S ribosomal protein S20 [Dehalococcoidia bacterium]